MKPEREKRKPSAAFSAKHGRGITYILHRYLLQTMKKTLANFFPRLGPAEYIWAFFVVAHGCRTTGHVIGSWALLVFLLLILLLLLLLDSGHVMRSLAAGQGTYLGYHSATELVGLRPLSWVIRLHSV